MGITDNPDDPGLHTLEESGMHNTYLVLSEEERAKGFVRPLRSAYIHLVCNTVTHMALEIAETYAVNPTFYGRTFCVDCGMHFLVGEEGDFIWLADGEVTGVKVGT